MRYTGTVVVFISVVGTLISDNLVDNLGVSLLTMTIIFAPSLVVVFALWYVRKKHSVHSIQTTRRELFYCSAILFTFALGTSAGDLIGESLGLGYPLSALVFRGVNQCHLLGLLYYFLHLNAVRAFWTPYTLTRPLGASLGDLLSLPAKAGV